MQQYRHPLLPPKRSRSHLGWPPAGGPQNVLCGQTPTRAEFLILIIDLQHSFLSLTRVFIIDYVALELRAPDVFGYTLSGLPLVWHPRPQICASVYDVRAAFRSLRSAVGKLQPVRWWISGIGGRLVYRLLFYVLLATGRCVSPGMGCSSPPCLGPMGFGSLDYCYTGLCALWLCLYHRCR